MTPLDRARDSFRSYELANAAKREWLIRRKQIQPSSDRPDEQRWATEGPRDWRELDTVRSDAA